MNSKCAVSDAVFLIEQVIAWSSVINKTNNKNILQMFFESISIDKSLNDGIVFKFQSMVHFSKWLLYIIVKYEQDKTVFICERTIYSDRYV